MRLARLTCAVTLALAVLAAPLGTRAQPAGKRSIVGVLVSSAGPRTLAGDNTRQGLRDLGYVEGQTIAFDLRFAGGKPEAFPGLAADLVRRKVDVIFASGPPAVRAARDATRTIPIVALDLESDPVQAGFARTLAQPGGNLTETAEPGPGEKPRPFRDATA